MSASTSLKTNNMTIKDHLHWVLNSPNLIMGESSPFALVEPPSASDIDRVSQISEAELARHLSKTKSHFLGSYFEALWQFYLLHSSRYELIASNLQFHHQGKTLGELDFIVYDHQCDRAIHQEIAIKFYLGTTANLANESENLDGHWVGPNAIDRLDLKINHLSKKQLPLATHPAVKERLEQLHISKLSSQALIKGYLFQPALHEKVPTSQYINPGHLSGVWYRVGELIEHIHDENLKENIWFKLEKSQWISSDQTLARHTESALALNDMIAFLSNTAHQQRAHMFATFKVIGGSLKCGEKVFVVPNDWPTPHSAPALQAASMNNQHPRTRR